MENPNKSSPNLEDNQSHAINGSFSTNPLLQSMENMNSCSYYISEQHEPQGQSQLPAQKSDQRQKSANQPNPYYIAEEPFDQRPVFHNTDIQIKKKDKKPSQKKIQPQQRQKQQDYIRMVNQGNGNYHRLDDSRPQSGCCGNCCTEKCLTECCTEACLQCALQVCLQCCIQILCQAIFKR